MRRFVAILSFTRTHTASLTMPVVMIAALVAHYSITWVFLFAIFAYCFHATGFMQNNIFDYKWDVTDPYKTHFPQMKGQINMYRAFLIDTAGIGLTFIYGMYLTDWGLPQFVFLTMSLLAGTLYNLYNKQSRLGPVLISLCYSMLIPFVMFGHDVTQLMVVYTAFAFLSLYFQIGVSGYIKDIEVNQYNTMENLGTRLIAGKIIFSTKAWAYSMALRTSVAMTGEVALLYMKLYMIPVWVYVILQITTLYFTAVMLRNSSWIRNRYLKLMSAIEVMNYLSIAVLFYPLYGLYWTLLLVAFPVAWFMAFNRIFYGTTIAPNV